ncbi:MAG: dihydropteroate synthase [Actinobacteria bacterium]|nr:dihydropteroate synthase [Actinomycetota bacterium]
MPFHTVAVAGRTLALGARPWLMGIVNASPDSFSDAGAYPDLEARVQLGRQLLAAGADILDVGGESGITLRPAVAVEEEIERVVPLISRLAGDLGAVVSVDTYKPAVAAAALHAGAAIVNDVSGLRDPELADVCAATGAALVLMHTRAAPKQRLQDPDLYDDVTADVVSFLRERMALARSRGVREEQLILDPGPDFAKTPAQTIELLGRDAVTINSGGEKIFPEEVESALKSHPDIVDAVVAGVPDDRWGERVAAVIQVREGAAPPSQADVEDHLASRVARYKIPRSIRVVESMQRSPAGKPDDSASATSVGMSSRSAPDDQKAS